MREDLDVRESTQTNVYIPMDTTVYCFGLLIFRLFFDQMK